MGCGLLCTEGNLTRTNKDFCKEKSLQTKPWPLCNAHISLLLCIWKYLFAFIFVQKDISHTKLTHHPVALEGGEEEEGGNDLTVHIAPGQHRRCSLLQSLCVDD